MFESSFECLDMCSARENDLLRSAEESRRSRKVKERGVRDDKRRRLLSAALIIKNLIL
jgi:hypothetical protein